MAKRPTQVQRLSDKLQAVLPGPPKERQALARRLSPMLSKVIADFQSKDGLREEERRHDEARRCREWAEEIATHVRRLMQLLWPTKDFKARLGVACRRGYLGNPPRSLNDAKTLLELYNFAKPAPTVWPSASQVLNQPLASLLVEAQLMAKRACADEKWPKGPPLNRSRIALSEEVAIRLQIAGVRPTTAKTGKLTRVLSVVQAEVGFSEPGCAYANFQRDASMALRSPRMTQRRQWLSQYLLAVLDAAPLADGASE